MKKRGKPRLLPPGKQAPVEAARGSRSVLLVTFFICAALTLLSYGADIPRSFSNDDYLLLDEVAWTPFWRLFSPAMSLMGWFRPWSREFHFWWLSHIFGPFPAVFHAVNVILWLCVVGLLLATLSRIAGARVAALATLGAFATSAWGLYPVWASCSQDLWQLLFGFSFLWAFLARRTGLAAVMLGLSLLSKETALLLVPIAAWIDRGAPRGSRATSRAWTTFLLVVAAWAIVNPALGGRVLFGSGARMTPSPPQPLSLSSGRWVLAAVNLERWPNPAVGWGRVIPEMVAWALAIGAAGAWAVHQTSESGRSQANRSLALRGLGWWAIAWLPLLVPVLQWHSYYGWLGLCGAWLAFAALAAPKPRAALWLLAVVAGLRPAEARTMSEEWATEQYQRVAADRLTTLRASLFAKHPTLPPHARVFLCALPAGISFRNGVRYSAALRVWYHDSTVVGGLLGDYVPPPSEDSQPADFFYAADSRLELLPIASAPVPLADSLKRSELWRIAEEQMTNTFVDFGEWHKALAGYARLERTWPDTARHAFNLGVSLAKLGDAAAAREWLNRADSLVGSPPLEGQGFLRRQSR